MNSELQILELRRPQCPEIEMRPHDLIAPRLPPPHSLRSDGPVPPGPASLPPKRHPFVNHSRFSLLFVATTATVTAALTPHAILIAGPRHNRSEPRPLRFRPPNTSRSTSLPIRTANRSKNPSPISRAEVAHDLLTPAVNGTCRVCRRPPVLPTDRLVLLIPTTP